MAGFMGRKAVLSIGGTDVAGVKTKGLTIGNSVIDITSDDDSGVRTSLTEVGETSVDITLSGLSKTHDLLVSAMSGSVESEVILTYPPSADGSTTTGATITGTFMMSSYAEGMEYNGATSFDVTLNSTGPVIYAAGV